MEFVVETIADNMPEVGEFRSDLVDLERAGGVSLQQLRQEMRAVQSTLTLTRSEFEANPENQHLKAFLEKQEPLHAKAMADLTAAEECYNKVTTYFCEEPSIEPATFFPVFSRLAKAYTTAERAIESRKRAAANAARRGKTVRTPREVMDTDVDVDALPSSPGV